MQSNIECDAVRCLHNKDGKCDAHHINVRCSDNLAVGDAHCNSYAYPINNAGSKLLIEMGKDMTVDRTVKGRRDYHSMLSEKLYSQQRIYVQGQKH